MAQVANAIKVFQFKVEINGLNQFECQGLQLPDPELDVTTHGDVNSLVKTPGLFKLGEITLEKLKAVPGTERWAWDWLDAARLALPSTVKQFVVVRFLDPSMTTIQKTYQFMGCWVSKISTAKLDRTSSDNIIETVTLQADDMKVI